jgi:hypothetical protein
MQTEKQPSYWAAGLGHIRGLMLILLGLFHAIAGLSRSSTRCVRGHRELRVQVLERQRGDGST